MRAEVHFLNDVLQPQLSDGSIDAMTLCVFHDLINFEGVAGAGLGSINLGNTNIDHLLLTGRGWLMLDAKGVGAGKLTIDDEGKGILIDPSGAIRPQPWMDSAKAYSSAGVLYRLTGGCAGVMGWVIPDETSFDENALEARFAQRGAVLLNLADVEAGFLDQLMVVSPPAAPADPKNIARLRRYVASEALDGS